MGRDRKVRQSRGGATTGPDAKACVPAASRIHNNTAATDPKHADPSESSPARRHREPIATEAEILVGTVMWLCRVRAWMAEQLDLATTAEGAPSETVTLSRMDLEAFRSGLAQAVSLLDRLTVDAAQLPPPAEPSASPEATCIVTTAAGRLH